MGSQQGLQLGDLEAALDELQQKIRKEPAELKHRIFLFQLLSLMGQWQRGLKQLHLCSTMSSSCLPMAQTYRQAIQCEVFRLGVFKGERSPIIFGEPQRWLALMIQGLHAQLGGQQAQAAALRSEALDLAPAVAGCINDQPFSWICDADSRLGPVMEMLINGRYFWVPFQHIKSLRLEPPSDLRDLIWMPAQSMWANGGEAAVLIPTRYPDSESCQDDTLRLSRKTLWLEQPEGVFQGMGQRILTTDRDDYALMDIRSIELQLADLAVEAR